jgi:hypothetical protein
MRERIPRKAGAPEMGQFDVVNFDNMTPHPANGAE